MRITRQTAGKMQSISVKKALQAGSSDMVNYQVNNAFKFHKAEQVSTIVILLFFLILSGFVLIPFIKISRSKFKYSFTSGDQPRLSIVVLLSACISCVFYILFFAFSKWIWSLNPQLSASEFTLFVRAYTFERDGIESFVLYILIFG